MFKAFKSIVYSSMDAEVGENDSRRIAENDKKEDKKEQAETKADNIND